MLTTTYRRLVCDEWRAEDPGRTYGDFGEYWEHLSKADRKVRPPHTTIPPHSPHTTPETRERSEGTTRKVEGMSRPSYSWLHYLHHSCRYFRKKRTPKRREKAQNRRYVVATIFCYVRYSHNRISGSQSRSSIIRIPQAKRARQEVALSVLLPRVFATN